MVMHKDEALETFGASLDIEREFDAPRERVWEAWTVPDLVMRWWGPKGYPIPVARISLRVGGQFLYCMRSPEGKDIWGTGFYREITPFERIVMTDSFADEKGNIVPATQYGMSPDFPRELLADRDLRGDRRQDQDDIEARRLRARSGSGGRPARMEPVLRQAGAGPGGPEGQTLVSAGQDSMVER